VWRKSSDIRPFEQHSSCSFRGEAGHEIYHPCRSVPSRRAKFGGRRYRFGREARQRAAP
jgi:hypothetical protein